MLIKNGFDKKKVKSLRGGVRKWKKKGFPLIEYKQLGQHKSKSVKERFPFLIGKQLTSSEPITIDVTLDAKHESCPAPLLKSRKKIQDLEIGQILEILTTDPGSLADIPSWAINTNQEFVGYSDLGDKGFRFIVRKLH